MGQASTYTPEIGAAICERLARGMSLRAACLELGVKEDTGRGWERNIPQFGKDSARARGLGCHALADDCLDIADDRTREPNDRRVSIDTRLRLMGKWLPKVYGDKQAVEHSGPDGGPIHVTAAAMTDDELASIARGVPGVT